MAIKWTNLQNLFHVKDLSLFQSHLSLFQLHLATQYPFQFRAMRSKILRSWHNATAKLHSLSWYCCAVLICTISRKIFYQIWCPSGKLSYRNYDPSTLSEILVSNSPLPPEFPVLPVGGYGYIFWDYTMQKMKFN